MKLLFSSLIIVLAVAGHLIGGDVVLGDGTDGARHSRYPLSAVTFTSIAAPVNFSLVSASGEYIATADTLLEQVGGDASAQFDGLVASGSLHAWFQSVITESQTSHFFLCKARIESQPIGIPAASLKLTDNAKQLLANSAIPAQARLASFARAHGTELVSSGKLYLEILVLFQYSAAANHSKLLAGLEGGYKSPGQAYEAKFNALQDKDAFRKNLTWSIVARGAIGVPQSFIGLLDVMFRKALDPVDPEKLDAQGDLPNQLASRIAEALNNNLDDLQRRGPTGYAFASDSPDTYTTSYEVLPEYGAVLAEAQGFLLEHRIASDFRNYYVNSLIPYYRSILLNLARYNMQLSLESPPAPLEPFHVYSPADHALLQNLQIQKHADLIHIENKIRACNTAYEKFSGGLGASPDDEPSLDDVERECCCLEPQARDVLEEIEPLGRFEDSQDWSLGTKWVATPSENAHIGDVICAYKYGPHNITNTYQANSGFLFDQVALTTVAGEAFLWWYSPEALISRLHLREKHESGCYSFSDIGSRDFLLSGNQYTWRVPVPPRIGAERTYVRVIEHFENGVRRLGPGGVPDIKYVEFVTFDELGFIKMVYGDHAFSPHIPGPQCGQPKPVHFRAEGTRTPRINYYKDSRGAAGAEPYVSVDFQHTLAGRPARIFQALLDSDDKFRVVGIAWTKNRWDATGPGGDIIPTALSNADVTFTLNYDQRAWDSVLLTRSGGSIEVSGTRKASLDPANLPTPAEAERIEVWASGSDGTVTRKLGGLKIEVKQDRFSGEATCDLYRSELVATKSDRDAAKERINCLMKIEVSDQNGDGVGELTDAIYLLNFLFLGGPPPTPIISRGCE